MTQIIVVETLERTGSIKSLFDSLSEAGLGDAILVARAQPKKLVSKDNFVPISRAAIGKALERAIKKASSKRLLIVAAESQLNEKQLRSFFSASSKLGDNDVAYAPVKVERQLVDFPAETPSELVQFLVANRSLPGLCVSAPKSLLMKAVDPSLESVVELIARTLLLAVAEPKRLIKLPDQVKLPSELAALFPLQLTGTECSRALELAVNNCNIEDVFPQFPWDKFKEESLSACYHTLAANFIRLGDYEQAKELLVNADQYEDSPRSLVLKGVIASRKGDWLTAAANLIAALQLYETRIKESDGHMVKFAPKDFQKINSCLLSGLDALNHRKNQAAAQHFAEAAFLYDMFFLEAGLLTLKAAH